MKIRMRNKLVFSCLLLAFTACKTAKETATGSLEGMNSTAVYESLLNHSVYYNTLSGKAKVSIKTPKNSLSANATVRMVRNEWIQLSFQFFGFEAFRIDLSPDSVVLVNRAHKWYVAESLSEIGRGVLSPDFNFSNLQSILTGRLFLAGKDTLTTKDMKSFAVKVSDDHSQLQTKDAQGIQYAFTGDYTHRIQSLLMSGKKEGKTVSLLSEYAELEALSPARLFPTKVDVKLTSTENEVYQLNIKYSKVELDKELTVESSIPNKYRRVPMAEALKALQKL